MSVRPVAAGSVKEGSYIVIDDEPCRVVEVAKSKPGKHGAAKIRIVAIGIFDDVKRSLVSPVNARVEAPMVSKRKGQVIFVGDDVAQLMD
ncbi:TPA: translation initiation factor IF-5A, partial [Candidatus Bathyarchaeota archaeon]|nr:translation initiation factor IF-5A [Candidatus Bathyarchaeota archaeon]